MHHYSSPEANSEQPEYYVWQAMRQRCQNARHKHYPGYGGRGITVCARWNTYANFIADMGKRPSPEHSLDRIDNDGNYEPGNCRWAVQQVQAKNRRFNMPQNRVITWRGETHHANEWCRRLGIPSTTLHNRFRLGWSIERALSTPSRSHSPNSS